MILDHFKKIFQCLLFNRPIAGRFVSLFTGHRPAEICKPFVRP
jgi:hypothetical protein